MDARQMNTDSPMDLGDVNYLARLRPGVWTRLFQFLSRDDVLKVQEAHHLSHSHHLCGEQRNEACEAFQQCIQDHTGWKCAHFTTCVKTEADGSIVASFTDRQNEDVGLYKKHIKHLSIITSLYLLDDALYRLLMQHLVDGNDSLQTIHIHVREDSDSLHYNFHLSRNSHAFRQRPSWSLFMEEVSRRRRVRVTLNVAVLSYSPKNVGRFCGLYSLPEDDAFCRHLATLRLPAMFPGEQQLFEHKPELTERPSLFFIAKLPTLQNLEISVYNIDTVFLQYFIRRARDKTVPPLRTLDLLVDLWLDHTEGIGPIREVSDTTWRDLAGAYPGLQVSCVIMGTGMGPEIEMSQAEVTGERVSELEAAGGAIDRPVENGLGSPHVLVTIDVPRHLTETVNEDNGWTVTFTSSPRTSSDALLTVLKRSAPLFHLTLIHIDVEDFNDVIEQCRLFGKTLRLVTCCGLRGLEEDSLIFQLTTDMFSMTTVYRRVEGGVSGGSKVIFEVL